MRVHERWRAGSSTWRSSGRTRRTRLAALVGRRGWKWSCSSDGRSPIPCRAPSTSTTSARILQGLGVMGELAAVTEPMDAYEWRSANGATLLTFGVEGLSGRRDGRRRPCSANPTSRPPRGARGLAASVSVRRGDEVAASSSPRSRPPCRCCPRAGAAGTVSARFVLGCDGAQSTVRVYSVRRWRTGVTSSTVDRRRAAPRRAPLAPAQRADLRSGPADDGRVGRTGPAALRVHAASR